MIRIEVKSNDVRSISGVSAKTGKPYSIRSQEGYALTFDENGNARAYPERITLQLEDNQPPFEAGVYTLSPQSIYVGDFGRLMLGRPKLEKLKPVQQANRPAAA